ncbi:hypothetical protein [Orenia marismortui]|nr:hypothetical protein [Orenia marismortui]
MERINDKVLEISNKLEFTIAFDGDSEDMVNEAITEAIEELQQLQQ